MKKSAAGFKLCTRRAVTLGFAFCAVLLAATPPLVEQYVEQYCVSCHNQKLKTAGVSLDTLDPANVSGGAATWERVLHKVRRGEMPPAGLPRPDAPAAAKFTASLEEALNGAAAANPNPGRSAVHRLNRADYKGGRGGFNGAHATTPFTLTGRRKSLPPSAT